MENKLGLDFGKGEEGFTLLINSEHWTITKSKVTKRRDGRLKHAELTHPDYGTVCILYDTSKQKNIHKVGDNQEEKGPVE